MRDCTPVRAQPPKVPKCELFPQMLAIWVLNILLGTLLGWVAAMVWACTTSRETAA